MKSKIHFLLIFLLLSVSTIAKSGTQETHIHGSATLTLTLEKELLEIQSESPAINLIGFKHKTNSPEEKQVVKQTEAILKSPKRLFSFVGTSCKPKEKTVDTYRVMDYEYEYEYDQHKHHNHSKGRGDSSRSEIKLAIALFVKTPEI
ncbi:DUF2796 domain-containing protein [Nitrosomonas sp.]|uniref:ZrgA family zinc uptake protein n=1 Tax=Nitrosomonas sp. TaxID=42353 RepID=UPI002085D14D|nr:DUF2796 domain-containing protein [Nitrosomonas sp.]GJL75695.1 MAG: hypothetical protein NMNS02_18010 [Nitrosomonas sp.]